MAEEGGRGNKHGVFRRVARGAANLVYREIDVRLPVEPVPDGPVLAVKLQALFGLSATPRIVAGRLPLVLHLLSPAQRPIQITRDLASFWANTYPQVKKELFGRYPKHQWPDDPV